MKSLKCNDVSGQKCPFDAHAESIEEAKELLKKHGMEVHPDMMEKLSDEDKKNMEAKMDQSIRNV